MRGEIMNLEGLGDEIMMLEGALGATITPKSIFMKIHEGYLPPIDPITVGTGAVFYGSLATAVFSSRFRQPALMTAAGAGILQVTRAVLALQEAA